MSRSDHLSMRRVCPGRRAAVARWCCGRTARAGTALRATEELTTAHDSARSNRGITACKVNEGESRAWVCRIRTGAPCGVSPRSNHTLTTLEMDRRRTSGAGLFPPSGRDVARAGFEPASPCGRRMSRCVCRRNRTITTSESGFEKSRGPEPTPRFRAIIFCCTPITLLLPR